MIKYGIAAIGLCLFLFSASGTELIPDGKWIFESNKNQGDIGKAFDSEISTIWSSGTAQEKGDYIKIDFGKNILAYSIVLTAADKYSFPRAIEISTSSDGNKWTVLSSGKIFQKGQPVKISDWNSLDFSFEPFVMRYLKLSLTESCGIPLKIAELSVLGKDGTDIKTGRSVIAISQSASSTLRFAAEELRKYLGRMGYFVTIDTRENADLKYPDYIFKFEKINSPALGMDGYIIQCKDKDIVISGNSDISFLYGVYSLLEHVGVRWFSYGDEGEYVPKAFSISDLDKINISETPSFVARGFIEPYFWNPEKIMWCARNKVNTMGLGTKHAYMLLESPLVGKIGGKDYYTENSGLMWPGGHSFSHFIGTAEYFEKHPEYFPIINGKRVSGNGQQLCTSNREVIEIFKKKIFDYLAKNPKIKTVSVTPNDGPLKWCECENCRKLDGPDVKEISHCKQMCRQVTDRYLVFVKEIAEAVKKKYPDAKIQAWGYSVFKAPPIYIKEMPDNVIMQICQYGEPAQIIGTVDDNKYTLDWMRGWAALKGPSLSIYDYFLLRERRPDLKTPLFFTEALFNKLKLYKNELDVKYYQTQFSWTTQNENAILFYAYVKALWNANLDENEFYNDFFRKYYGPAAEPMGKYFRMMMKRVKDKKILYGNNYNCPPPKDLYDAEVVPVIDGLFAEANKLAGKEVIIKQRIRRDYEGYQYSKKCLGFN